MMATDTTNLSRKGLLRVLVAQNDALLAGQSDIKTQLTQFREDMLMALNKNEQDVVDAVNAATNVVGDALTAAVTAITDLFGNKSSITLADVQPALTTMTSAAAALKTLATTDDPALTPTAPPVTVTQPDGTQTPVSTAPDGEASVP
jgi:hypothetical protein